MVVIGPLVLLKQSCHKSSLTDPDNSSPQSTENWAKNEQKDSKRIENDRNLKSIVDGIADGPNNKLFFVGNLNKRCKNVAEHERAVVGNQEYRSQMFVSVMVLINVGDDGAEGWVGEGKK